LSTRSVDTVAWYTLPAVTGRVDGPCSRVAWTGARVPTVKRTYLGDVGELDDDAGSLLRRRLAEHHALDPLRQAVEQRHGPLQLGVVLERRRRRVALEILELQIFNNHITNALTSCRQELCPHLYENYRK